MREGFMLKLAMGSVLGLTLLSLGFAPVAFAATPLVTAVNTVHSDGAFTVGEVIDFTVTYDQLVNVSSTGTPSFPVNSGGVASYLSGSGSAVLTFRYTVAGSENSSDLDYSGVMSLNGAIIENAGSEAADNTLPVIGTFAAAHAIVIDTTAPVVSQLDLGGDGQNGVSSTLTLTITADAVGYTNGSSTINGKPFNTFIDNTDNTYTATYVVASGDQDRAAGTVPASVILTDAAGNSNVAYTTVVVNTEEVDANAPTLTPVSIASNNPNSTLARAGDVVTLSFTANEAIANPTSTSFVSGGNPIAGLVTVSNPSGNNWTATYTVSGSDTSGSVGFSVPFEDLFANSGLTVTTTTNASAVTVDVVAPVISALSINPSTSTRKIGDVIVLTIDSDGTSYTAGTITVNGVATTGFGSAGGNNYSANYTIVEGNSTVASGALTASAVVIDPAGNTSTVFSTLPVNTLAIDATRPTLSSVTMASDNTNSAYGTTGDTVNLTFTASEAIATPVVAFTSNNIAVVGPVSYQNTTGTTWVASYDVNVADTDGTVGFSISFADVAGNAGAASVTTLSSGSAVTVDKIAPTFSAVTIASNNANTALAKSGDSITLSLTSSENIQTPVVTLGGSSATASGSNTSWTASRTFSGSDTEGAVALTLDAQDLAGNPATQVTATTNSSTVTFDKTVPTVASITTKDANGDGSVDTATIVFSEPVLDSSFAAGNFSIGGSTGNILTTGTSSDNMFDISLTTGVTGTDVKDVTYTAGSGTDLAGNALANVLTGSVVEVDGANPVYMSARTRTTTTIELTFSEDLNGATVTNADFSLTPTSTLTTPDAVETNTTSGIVRITLATPMLTSATPTVNYIGSVQDLASLVAPTSSKVATDGVPAILAEVTSVPALTNDNTPDYTFGASEVGTVAYSGDCSSVTTAVASGNNTVTFNTLADGAHSNCSLLVTDVASNTSTLAVTAFTVDTIAPLITARSLSSNNASSVWAKVGDLVTLAFTANENLLNATATINNTAATVVGTTTSWSASRTMTIGDVEGLIPFLLDYQDLATNPGLPVSTTTNGTFVEFDKTPPTLPTVTIASNHTNPAYAKVGHVVTITFTSSEILQTPVVTIGNATATVTGSDTSWSASRTMVAGDAEGVVAFTIDYQDRASNAGVTATATTNASSVTFDKTVPLVDAGSDVATHLSFNQNASAGDQGPAGIATYLWTKETGGPETVNFDTPNAEDTVISVATSSDKIGYLAYGLRLTVVDNAGNSAFDDMVFNWGEPDGSKNFPTGGGGGRVLGVSTTTNPTTSTTQTMPEQSSNSNSTPGQVLGENTFVFGQNLRFSMRNEDVRALQVRLATLGLFKVEPTGYFGQITLAAVKAFQKANNLPETGFVGPLTRAVLNKNSN